jgi:hypothetical protein
MEDDARATSRLTSKKNVENKFSLHIESIFSKMKNIFLFSFPSISVPLYSDLPKK